MPQYTQSNSLWFEASTDPDLLHYDLDVMVNAIQIGSTQIIPTTAAVNGEVEIPLSSVTALPEDASGLYTFYVYTVDSFGRSQLPLIVFNVELSFSNRLLPAEQDKRGVYLRNNSEPFFSGNFPAGDRP